VVDELHRLLNTEYRVGRFASLTATPDLGFRRQQFAKYQGRPQVDPLVQSVSGGEIAYPWLFGGGIILFMFSP